MKVPEGARRVPIRGIRKDGTRGRVAWALVSEEDYERVSALKWSFAGRGYVRAAGPRRRGEKFQTIYMHRLVMDAADGMQVDHRNGDKLDNRRENLREVTNSQNHAGFSSKPPGVSGERGVYLDKRRGTYQARVTHLGKTYQSAGFKTVEEAVAWRNRKGREIHGEFYFAAEEMGAELG